MRNILRSIVFMLAAIVGVFSVAYGIAATTILPICGGAWVLILALVALSD